MRSNSSYFAFADSRENAILLLLYYRTTQSLKSQPNLEIGKLHFSHTTFDIICTLF